MTKTLCPYACIARYYKSRADYCEALLESCMRKMGLRARDRVADMGAGTGKLTIALAKLGLQVIAVEPSDAMRQVGIEETRGLPVTWQEGSAEQSSLEDQSVKAVFFGEVFSQVDGPRALAECKRVLGGEGWICCVENQRDQDDALQAEILEAIRTQTPLEAIESPDYTAMVSDSEYCSELVALEDGFLRLVDRQTELEAWLSLPQVQASPPLQSEIEELLEDDQLEVPYTTRALLARIL